MPLSSIEIYLLLKLLINHHLLLTHHGLTHSRRRGSLNSTLILLLWAKQYLKWKWKIKIKFIKLQNSFAKNYPKLNKFGELKSNFHKKIQKWMRTKLNFWSFLVFAFSFFYLRKSLIFDIQFFSKRIWISFEIIKQWASHYLLKNTILNIHQATMLQ